MKKQIQVSLVIISSSHFERTAPEHHNEPTYMNHGNNLDERNIVARHGKCGNVNKKA